MNLTTKEKKIFVALHMSAHKPVAEVARETGYRDHVVRHAIAAMRERAVFQTDSVVDEARLGLQHYRMYFNLSASTGQKLENVERMFWSDPIVAYFGRMSGDFRYCAAFYVQHFSQIERLLDRVKEQYGGTISRKIIAAGRGWNHFGKKYLDNSWKAHRILQTGFRVEPQLLEEIDSQLLGILAQDPLATARDLARQTGSAATTISYRLLRLRRLGILGDALHRINIAATGVHSFFALIRTKYPSHRFSEDLRRYSLEHPNITELLVMQGGWDYELFVEAEEGKVMHRITQELESFFPDNVESIAQLVRLEDIKWNVDFRSILTGCSARQAA